MSNPSIFSLMAGALSAVGLGAGANIADSMVRAMAGIPFTDSMFEDAEDGLNIPEAPQVTERVIRDVENAENLPIQGMHVMTPEELGREAALRETRRATNQTVTYSIPLDSDSQLNETYRHLRAEMLEDRGVRLPQMVAQQNVRLSEEALKGKEMVDRESTQVADMEMTNAK